MLSNREMQKPTSGFLPNGRKPLSKGRATDLVRSGGLLVIRRFLTEIIITVLLKPASLLLRDRGPGYGIGYERAL